MFNPYNGIGMAEYTENAIKNLTSISELESHNMDGLRWIRDNAEGDALIVSDSAVMTDNDYCYSYGIVSERQQYIEGVHMLRFGGEELQTEINRRKALVRSMYQICDIDSLNQLKAEGVDYIVQTNSISPDFVPNEMLEMVASSDNINVFRIH